MKQAELLQRTKAFAIRVVKLVAALPNNRVCDVLGRQVLKSGTSIGANYREAIHASSRKQFITMLEIVQRETEETAYWLELIVEAGLIESKRLVGLQDESRELLAIITASIKTAKKTGH